MDALLYILQPIYEATDSGNAGARLFFADFSKGLDLIDHNILLEELRGLEVSPSIINWIAGFLAGQKQAVTIEGTLLEWKTLNMGIPQGTKLGFILLTVMTNRLLRHRHLRTKFVYDTTAVEILPWNPILCKYCKYSLLIHRFGKKTEIVRKRALVALKNNMVSVSLGNVKKKRKKYGHKCWATAKCNNRSDNRPDLSFHSFPKDLKTRKEWELRIRRGDVYFKSVDHKFCCKEHFCPTDFKAGLTGQRRDLRKGSVPSILQWAPEKVSLREGCLKIWTENISHAQREEAKQSMAKMLQDREGLPDCKTVAFSGPPTLGEFVENFKTEVEHLKEELCKAKEKEYLFRFGLESFSSSPEDINFYTGFPDYKTLVAFWHYIKPNEANLTYYCSAARDVSGFVSNVPFPCFNATGKKFPRKGVGAQRTLQPIDEFWLFPTRVKLGLF